MRKPNKLIVSILLYKLINCLMYSIKQNSKNNPLIRKKKEIEKELKCHKTISTLI